MYGYRRVYAVLRQSNLRWCSDSSEMAYNNKEKIRVALELDCCDREMLGHVATAPYIKSKHAQDLAIFAAEHCFRSVNILPYKIAWLTDIDSCFSV